MTRRSVDEAFAEVLARSAALVEPPGLDALPLDMRVDALIETVVAQSRVTGLRFATPDDREDPDMPEPTEAEGGGPAPSAGEQRIDEYVALSRRRMAEMLGDPAVPWPQKRAALALASAAISREAVPRLADGVSVDLAATLARRSDAQWLAYADEAFPGAVRPRPEFG